MPKLERWLRIMQQNIKTYKATFDKMFAETKCMPRASCIRDMSWKMHGLASFVVVYQWIPTETC